MTRVIDGVPTYTVAQGWSLHATTPEIAGEQIRMAAVSAGDEDPGWKGEAFERASKFYGPSIIAHAVFLLRKQGMTHNEIMRTAFKELRELQDME